MNSGRQGNERQGNEQPAYSSADHSSAVMPNPAVISDPALLDTMARDNAQIAADFIWAGNRAAAREQLLQAVTQLNQAEAAARTLDV